MGLWSQPPSCLINVIAQPASRDTAISREIVEKIVSTADPPSVLPTFDAILNAAKGGEEWAWAVIYRDLAGVVTGYLALRGAPEPEDQASETLFDVARNIGRFEGDEASFRSWVFVIAHRRLIDARRKKGRQVETIPLFDSEVHPMGDVESEALDKLALAEMIDLLAPLTDDQRDVVALRLIADLSLEETADVMGKGVGAIKALQRRAVGNLKKALETQEVSR
jgi:RNA polymerase sigma-70 factor (ECF subfamily)